MSSLGRFRQNEISLQRVLGAAKRRITDLPSALNWRFAPQAAENRVRIETFRDIHRGQRCVVIANGPSLARMDLQPLGQDFTIGMNRIYLNFEPMGFYTNYYIAINELVIEQFGQEIKTLSMPKFINWNRRHYFTKNDMSLHYLRIRFGLSDDFQTDLTNPISSGGTVTYAALQLAYFMGFHQVVLIGLDHRFTASGAPNTAARRQGEDRDHFDPNYFPAGTRWQLPDLRRSEIAYAIARRVYEQDGRQILDATIDGECDVFQKVDYREIFA